MSLRIAFAGTPDFAARMLKGLLGSRHRVVCVYTQPDRPSGRGRKRTPSPVKRLAISHGLPFFQPLDCRDQDGWRPLSDAKVDVLVVAAYGLLLSKAVLDTPRHGCLNVHASLLPRWRGAAPIQHAILAGDRETGVSIMRMDEGLDTGAVLRTMSCPILGDENAASLHDRLALLGEAALLDTLENLEFGRVKAEPQKGAFATYAGRIRKSHARLDWNRPAEILARQVRAYVPWPVAYTFYEGEPLRIWESQAIGGGENIALPGEVVASRPTGIDVAAKVGLHRWLRIQPSGAKPMSVADFLHGRRLVPGYVFESP